jgi:hypothetical protein
VEMNNYWGDGYPSKRSIDSKPRESTVTNFKEKDKVRVSSQDWNIPSEYRGKRGVITSFTTMSEKYAHIKQTDGKTFMVKVAYLLKDE